MFYGFVITEAGNRLLARQVAGDHLDISRVVMDKGTCESAEEAIKLTAPIDPGPNGVHTVPVCVDSNVNFIVEYRSDLNGGLQEDFWISGFGVYARNPDFDPKLPPEVHEDNPEEIMVYYGSLGDAKQKVKAYVPGSVPDTRRYPVSLEVTTGVEVDTARPAEAWMTAEDVDEYCTVLMLPQFMTEAQKLVSAHNKDLEAHPGMTARIQAIETALNGSGTIIRAGDPTTETIGKKGQHYINPDTGAEFECTDVTEDGYIWIPAGSETPIRDVMAATGNLETALDNVDAALADVDARLTLLELMYRTDVSGNPFTVNFDDLTRLRVTGVWNTEKKRVEF